MAVDLPFVTRWPGSLQATIPSYLFTEYNDDADCQAFVDAFNAMAQQYVNLFNQISLPVYTGALIVDSLLDWVGTGLYGIARPTLPSGINQVIGPLNTWALNTINFNAQVVISNQTYYVVNDDIYKRCITWAFYKGDGHQFSINWLKRRILRFLLGTNGTAPAIDQTYDISVAIAGSAVTITINNSASYAQAVIFKAAFLAHALESPYQFTYTITLA